MEKKKSINNLGLLIVFLFSLVVISSSALAENCTSFTYSEWGACSSGVQTRSVINSTPSGCTGGNFILNQSCSSLAVANLTNVDRAFSCLVGELKSDCSGAKTVQELAFSILASPNNTGACVNELLKKNKSEGCFGDNNNCGIKETAWAILALDHVGKNTTKSADWLKSQNKSSSDVEWFLQQDSVGDTTCKLTYNGGDYSLIAKENKKLSGNIGNCFSFAQSDYWLRLSENCFDTEFVLSCDKEFFSGWHYKSFNSPILNVLSETAKTAANQPVKLRVNSKCFGSSTGCNFEDTAWAALALKNLGLDIKPYVPYLISAEDSNLMYLPAALNYLVLDWSTLYGTKLIQQQKSETFWEAPNTVYGEVYDTTLALLAFGKQNNQKQITNARDWLWNTKQDALGCWNSRNIRDTAFVLWALEQRTAQTDSNIVITPATTCAQGNYFCDSQSACSAVGGETLRNYACSGFSQVCCSKNTLQSCSNLLGEICSSGKDCSSTSRISLEGDCCLGECIDPVITTNACEEEDSTYTCRSSCLASQEEVSYSCGSGSEVCCARKPEEPSSGIPLWIWFLIGILILLIVLAIVFRDRIKVYIYKKKGGESSNASIQRPPFSPSSSRPGFPPLTRPVSMAGRPMPSSRRPMPPQGSGVRPAGNPSAQNTLDRLKQMSK